MTSFFQDFKDMECLQGDTLPVFSVQTQIPFADRGNYSMVLILESDNLHDAGTRILQKNCTASVWTDDTDETEKTNFSVQITSEDTKKLSGVYKMHFRLTDENTLEYAKICGTLHVRRTAQKGESA